MQVHTIYKHTVNTTPAPTTASHHTTDGSGTGPFVSHLTPPLVGHRLLLPRLHNQRHGHRVRRGKDVVDELRFNPNFLYPTVSNDRFGLNTASQPLIQNIAQIERSESSMLFRDKAMSAKLNLKPET